MGDDTEETQSCDGCGNDFLPEELDNGMCAECVEAEANQEECSGCGKHVDADELDRFGECYDCRNADDFEDDEEDDDDEDEDEDFDEDTEFEVLDEGDEDL